MVRAVDPPADVEIPAGYRSQGQRDGGSAEGVGQTGGGSRGRDGDGRSVDGDLAAAHRIVHAVHVADSQGIVLRHRCDFEVCDASRIRVIRFIYRAAVVIVEKAIEINVEIISLLDRFRDAAGSGDRFGKVR